MFEVWMRIVSALVIGCFVFIGTTKMLGVIQQGGYKGVAVCKWLAKKENTYFLRLIMWALLLLFSAGIVVLCFAFLGERIALCLSAIPFLFFCVYYCIVDRRYALKVPVKVTGRVKRLSAVYFFLVACVTYAIIALGAFVKSLLVINGLASWGALLCYLPVSLMPVLAPWLFLLAGAITYPFESLRNRRYIEKAKTALAGNKPKTVAIVGSYGKTSVKQILTTLLSQKYKVCATPASFNTPIGIAKTVFGEGFADAEVFVAEMGARKKGDIQELCDMVRPDYALFTGVCAQHVATFGSLDGVKEEKSIVLKSGAKVCCAASLKREISAQYEALTDEQKEAVCFLTGEEIVDLQLRPTSTKFTVKMGEDEWVVDAPLLGKHSAENIALCICMARKMGLSHEEIAKGLSAIQPVEHRLQLIEENGVYILDDAYNANERSAVEAIDALCRFEGRKILVTPGLVETGVLEKTLGENLGKKIAEANLDKVILIGAVQVDPVKAGYENAGGDKEKLTVCFTLEKAKEMLAGELQKGDAVLFLNDLPDIY